MKIKQAIAMLLVVVVCFSFTACKKEEAGNINTEQYLNNYLSADPNSLDVSLRSDTYSSSIVTNVMEGLVRLVDREGEYFMAPGDAQSWESSKDGTVWTFHLGDNKWSDGQPVTAEQYVYSLKRSANPKTGCPNSWFLTPILNYNQISKGEMDISELGVKAIDAKTLEITLANTTPAFLEMCNATIYYPQREDKVKEWGEKYGTEAKYTIYNGPFVLDSWVHNSSLVLKKNPNYWDVDSVKLDTVNISIVSDITTVINSYKSGTLDYVNVNTKEWLDEFKKDENSKYEHNTTQRLVFNFYNTKNDLFKNEKIRRAFNLCIDHEDINEMCFGGLRVPTYGWVVPTISVGERNFREAAGDSLKEMKAELTALGKTPKDLLIEGMKELGLGDDASKLDLTLSLAGTNDWYRTYGEYLQQVYSTELGVELKIDFADWGIFSENVKKGNYQLAFMSWGAYYNDPYDVLSIFYSEWDQVGTGWSNSEYDALINKGAIEMNEETRLQYYMDAEKILMNDNVVCPLATNTTHIFYRNYVYGYSTLGFASQGYKYMYTEGR
ncbi:peptide ABC transporter substrate-binding protein [Clostridium sp. 'deep sea']|uniref:peptide ABC transporter substrate-binding protein n=1 Tax=Clostridium sp. 'deep sea' TaxID=2779445 RepID=UPI0018964C39|nr:peptide ABC transporter substrate-binding protein [Clostridium sp. 'deep sea']QOR36094.1 peptide ABC transporter substrate-binding protein [Clostridium sp. 'deep sea']